MIKRKTTWLVIADSARARILANTGEGGALVTVSVHESAAAHELSRDIGSDSPGRSMQSYTGTRHAIEPKHDPQRERKRHFAAELADELNQAGARHAFDALVLIAPSRTLGDLRQELDKATRAKGQAHALLDAASRLELALTGTQLGELCRARGEAARETARPGSGMAEHPSTTTPE